MKRPTCPLAVPYAQNHLRGNPYRDGSSKPSLLRTFITSIIGGRSNDRLRSFLPVCFTSGPLGYWSLVSRPSLAKAASPLWSGRQREADRGYRHRWANCGQLNDSKLAFRSRQASVSQTPLTHQCDGMTMTLTKAYPVPSLPDRQWASNPSRRLVAWLWWQPTTNKIFSDRTARNRQPGDAALVRALGQRSSCARLRLCERERLIRRPNHSPSYAFILVSKLGGSRRRLLP